MASLFAASAFLIAGASAVVVARDFVPTLTVPLPTGAAPFTSEVTSCGTVSGFKVVGVPTGTFVPGTQTIFLPPQAQPSSTTIVDPATNETEVIVASPVEGTCADFPFPPAAPPSSPGAPSPTPTPNACPEKGCTGLINRSAQTIIDALNQVTFQSQNLQAAAKRLGAPPTLEQRDTDAAQDPITDVVKGLRNIISTLITSLPRITFIPVLPPGCDSDTVVIALARFVQVHQALLNILIGRSGALQNGPLLLERNVKIHPREEGNHGGQAGPIGAPIAAALRGVEGVVDTAALAIINLIPSRSECAKEQKKAIDGTLQDSIQSYE